MPKTAIGVIVGAFAFLIGFTLGAVFTIPQNEAMENLVLEQKGFSAQIVSLNQEKNDLITGNELLQGKIDDLEKEKLSLKDRLIKSYEIEKTDTTRKTSF